MGKKIEQIFHWWQDGVSFKETIALSIIFIFGYLVYFACKKMMCVGLVELDIEFLKITSSLLTIIICFYFTGSSAETIIQTFFNNKIKKEDN